MFNVPSSLYLKQDKTLRNGFWKRTNRISISKDQLVVYKEKHGEYNLVAAAVHMTTGAKIVPF